MTVLNSLFRAPLGAALAFTFWAAAASAEVNAPGLSCFNLTGGLTPDFRGRLMNNESPVYETALCPIVAKTGDTIVVKAKVQAPAGDLSCQVLGFGIRRQVRVLSRQRTGTPVTLEFDPITVQSGDAIVLACNLAPVAPIGVGNSVVSYSY